MKVVSWNVAGRLKKLDAQLDALREHDADVIALQELTESSAPLWRAKLTQAGYPSFAHRQSPRKYAVGIASKSPATLLEPFEVLWPERMISIDLDGVEIHCVHLPLGCNNLAKKIDAFYGIQRAMVHCPSRPKILCGDFNSPREETSAGLTIPWGKDGSPQWNAELSVLRSPKMIDLFRQTHGYSAEEFSWIWSNRIGRRFDHILTTPEIAVGATCGYDHAVRTSGLSDHSAIWAEIKVETPVASRP